MKKELEGIIVPLITPFTEKGALDQELFEKEARHIISTGVHGVSPGGSTGEGAAVTDEELAQMIRIIRKVDPAVTVVAGIIRNSTKAAVEAGLMAKESGANALMVTPVSYNVLVPDDEGNYSFYETISDLVGLPIVIYNVVPQNTISAALFAKLLEIENVVGIKQSCGSVPAFFEMKMINGKRGKIFSATDEMIYTTFELGADGAISAILTVFPELCMEMWEFARTNNHNSGLAIQRRLYFTWMAIAGNQFPIRIKYALSLLGREPGYPRGPIIHLPDSDKEKIRSAMETSGLI